MEASEDEVAGDFVTVLFSVLLLVPEELAAICAFEHKWARTHTNAGRLKD